MKLKIFLLTNFVLVQKIFSFESSSPCFAKASQDRSGFANASSDMSSSSSSSSYPLPYSSSSSNSTHIPISSIFEKGLVKTIGQEIVDLLKSPECNYDYTKLIVPKSSELIPFHYLILRFIEDKKYENFENLLKIFINEDRYLDDNVLKLFFLRYLVNFSDILDINFIKIFLKYSKNPIVDLNTMIQTLPITMAPNLNENRVMQISSKIKTNEERELLKLKKEYEDYLIYKTQFATKHVDILFKESSEVFPKGVPEIIKSYFDLSFDDYMFMKDNENKSSNLISNTSSNSTTSLSKEESSSCCILF